MIATFDARRKRGKIRLAGTISREGMRTSRGTRSHRYDTLYLISSSLAMVSRKEVLTMDIDASLEIRYVREPQKAQGKKIAQRFLIHQI